jgi:hypothetical protein
VAVDSNDVVHSSTHSKSDTQKPATPAMIWFLVSVEMNVPIARRHPPWSKRPRYPTRIGFKSGLPYANRKVRFTADTARIIA